MSELPEVKIVNSPSPLERDCVRVRVGLGYAATCRERACRGDLHLLDSYFCYHVAVGCRVSFAVRPSCVALRSS